MHVHPSFLFRTLMLRTAHSPLYSPAMKPIVDVELAPKLTLDLILPVVVNIPILHLASKLHYAHKLLDLRLEVIYLLRHIPYA